MQLSDCKLKSKSCESWTAFTNTNITLLSLSTNSLWVLQITLLNYSGTCFQIPDSRFWLGMPNINSGSIAQQTCIGCPCHLVHLCARKGAKELSVNVEHFVIDIYHNFGRSAKLKKQLREFLNFKNNKVRKVINLGSTRWLSLGKCLERTLREGYSLESYFLSNFDLDDDPTENDPDEKASRIQKRLVKCIQTTC